MGAVPRFCGGAFGSCATFGVTSGTSASAPGQPPADVLKAKLITAPSVTHL
uniref:type I 3-dehydroquinate dehydratase n=1 Tax=Gemmiger formicilis TaxID=745368 RepID=UPI0040251151